MSVMRSIIAVKSSDLTSVDDNDWFDLTIDIGVAGVVDADCDAGVPWRT